MFFNRNEPLLLISPRLELVRLTERFSRFPWGLLVLITTVFTIGMVALYSAVGGMVNGANFIIQQSIHFTVAVILMVVIALGESKFYRRHVYFVYAITLILLLLVMLSGTVGMGARRWLDLGIVRIQPSEMMKLALIMALSRYFHDQAVTPGLRLVDLSVPILLILPALLMIIRQPDLGTAVVVAATGCVVIFVAGITWKVLLISVTAVLASMPLVWNWLHGYQRQRILTLFFPEQDPLGTGYHIIQSKIAVGSGGLTGKGFMAGSQNHLHFLPERHTDFIFSVLAEEWGFVGVLALITVYGLIIFYGLLIATMARDRFGMLLASGITSLFAFHVMINIGMVVGLLPVVGIPLPLVSYGGSSMLTVMVSMGLLAHVSVHSKQHGSYNYN
ncbi:MAG: rod shape-determining protein RodA [Magnetococcales bacterium]|nr:rod shape-determining protein RodA [Magnetococcales bacterium]